VRLHYLEQKRHLLPVRGVGGLGKRGLDAELPGHMAQREVVAGEAGAPVAEAPRRYLRPMRESSPRASVTRSTSASGRRSQTRASMLANVILLVTNVLTASFAISALMMFLLAPG